MLLFFFYRKRKSDVCLMRSKWKMINKKYTKLLSLSLVAGFAVVLTSICVVSLLMIANSF